MSGSEGIKKAGIIIIGNEILSGKIHDTNSYYLASELRRLGVIVMRILTIPDEIDVIASETCEFSKKYDYVFTSGGVGPTHDDVTMEGIAQGFGVKLIRHPELEDFFRDRYGNHLSDPIIKMTRVPEGASVVRNREMGYPLVMFRNLYIFPGIPEYLREKFSHVSEELRTPVFYLKRYFLNARESEIANTLNAVVKKHRDVIFGSYPVLNDPEYKIIVTAESKSENALNEAGNDFVKMLPEGILVKVE
jgi:molybdenum cofactor synthesis domain-containing protein